MGIHSLKRNSVTTLKNGRVKVIPKISKRSMTDQSHAKMSDINVIIEQYRKTGLLPEVKQSVAQFLDLTEIPDYMEAFNVIQNAKELFYQLPASVRKLCDQDPSKLEEVLADPKNKDLLVKAGVLYSDSEKLEIEQEAQQQQEGQTASSSEV
jgi:phage internal scaffolding protein